MSSRVINIPEGFDSLKKKKETQVWFLRRLVSSFVDKRKLAHSIKVGVGLVLVSSLYLLDPLYEKFGLSAMWAVMTVVVMFEFFAGATLGKGLNRAIGTILGGGLGCLAAALAQEVGGVGSAIVILSSVFIFGAAATYSRLVPIIKKRYDYGAMIFILTFNLVVVSGIRAEKVMELAWKRLLTIFIGFSICIFISLLVFPIWASDDLHNSLASRFYDLAASIEGCLEEYFNNPSMKQSHPGFSFNCCKSVLQSKSKDEALANFAKWEPWHGRFGLFHPWDKYLEIGELLRELAATILSLEPCLKSSRESSGQVLKQFIEEPCEVAGITLGWILREQGENAMKMRRSQMSDLIMPKLKYVRQELSLVGQKLGWQGWSDTEMPATISFVFILTEMVEKVEQLTKEVEELTRIIGFHDN